MDDNMPKTLSPKRFYKAGQCKQGLGFLVAGLGVLFILDPTQTVMVWGFLGNVCIAILPHLVIGGAAGFLALCFNDPAITAPASLTRYRHH